MRKIKKILQWLFGPNTYIDRIDRHRCLANTQRKSQLPISLIDDTDITAWLSFVDQPLGCVVPPDELFTFICVDSLCPKNNQEKMGTGGGRDF